MARNITWSAFLPRSRSKIVFVFAMACYAFSAAALIRVIATAFGAPYPPVDAFARRYPALRVADLLVFAPAIESLVLIGIIELLRWLRSPAWVQVACSAAVSASLHALVSIPLAFVVAPGWVIMSISYLIWRRVSWKMGFVIVASIHALLNLLPAIWIIGYAARHT